MAVYILTHFYLLMSIFQEIMGKNKQKGKKHQNVFQVANKQSKPKSKTKPVKSSLKHVSTFHSYKSWFVWQDYYSVVDSLTRIVRKNKLIVYEQNIFSGMWLFPGMLHVLVCE